MLGLVAGVVLAATTLVGVAYAALPATVQGVTPRGTTINLFDYWLSDNAGDRFANDKSNPKDFQNTGINSDHALKFGKGMGASAISESLNTTNVNHWTGNSSRGDAFKPAPRTGIVQSQLGADGYPALSNVLGNESLAYLFDSSSRAGKASYRNVGGLLQVNDDGYYYYNSTDNFAQFDEDSNSFTLYNTWGVKTGGQSPNGQFFPFNAGDEVFNESGAQNGVTSTNPEIHHYFGLNMSTNFIQQYGGHTEEHGGKVVTYNFSGDDDVWVYIDGVLVGDLGGIHDKVALQINFATGEVVVYSDGNNNNEFDEKSAKDGNELGAKAIDSTLKAGNDVYYQRTTLKALFKNAGVDVSGWKSDTLPDNTYHTLKFFYLERGNTDSNMSLKYNLVTIPETDIQKVDQDGKGVAEAVFSVTDQNGTPVCTATTENDGTVVLMDADRRPLTIDQLAAKGCTSLTFTETTVPEGYRSMGAFTMNIEQLTPKAGGDTLNVLLSASPWTTGAYAEPRVTVSLPTSLTNDSSYDTENGMFFAVVEKKVKGDWYPVTGNGRDGWKVADSNSNAAILKAGHTTNAVFVIASNGAYQADIDALPGDIHEYEYFKGSGATLRVAYFYVDSKSFTTSEEPQRIEDTADFGRQFSAHLYLPDMVNRVAVRKLDENGKGLKGAVFGLYTADQVNVDEKGVATLKDGAKPNSTATTDDLTKANDGIALSGGATFAKLKSGTYYIGEISAPSGYAVNKTLTKVIVTSTGVYADAGVADDGVRVTRGIGRIVQSVQQFAENDGIDATLADIIAQPMTLTESGLDSVSELEIDRNATDLVHLKYAADASDSTLDYAAQDGTTFTGYSVDEGIPYLVIAQDHDDVHKTEPRQVIDDNITNLFSGVTIVQVSDEPVGSLKVSKTVKGKVDDAAEFDFTVTFERVTKGSGDEGESQEQRTPLTNDEARAAGMQLAVAEGDPEGVTLGDDGSITFKLKSGESAVVTNIPAGVTYTVAEKPVSNYETSYDPGSTGVIVKNKQAEVAVTNTYAPEITLTGDARLKVTKKVTGADNDTAFSFTAVLNEEKSHLADSDDAASAGIKGYDGDFKLTAATQGNFAAEDEQVASFGDVTFTKPGVYVFDVTEDQKTPDPANGWTYDSTTRQITVTVTTGDDGDLHATTVVDGTDTNNPTFTNAYNTGTVNYDAEGGLQIIKNLTGHDIEADQFEFTMAAKNDDAKAKLGSETKVFKTAGAQLQDDAASETVAVVTGMNFTKDDAGKTFTFTVAETKGGGDGYTNDDHVYNVSIAVTDGGNGSLTVTTSVDGTVAAVYTAAAAQALQPVTLTFNNSYDAGETTVGGDASIKIAATKTLEGRAMTDGEFHFTIKDVKGNTVATGSNAAAADGEAGNVSFSAITYSTEQLNKDVANGIATKAADENGATTYTYIYTVSEDTSSLDDGVTAVAKSYQVTVTVTDDGEGKLTAAVDQGDNKTLEFVNTYGADQEARVNLNGNKILAVSDPSLTGPSLQDIAGKFTFTLTGSDGAPMPKKTTAVNDSTGGVDFGTITYTMESVFGTAPATGDAGAGADDQSAQRAKEFTYTVTESGSYPGITNDSSTKTIKVTVTDNGDGTLSVNKVADQGAAAGMDFTFTNTYSVEPSASTPTGKGGVSITKTLAGRNLKEGEFAFQMSGVSAPDQIDPGASVLTAVNAADGSVSFGDVTFTKPGTYTYAISEIPDELGGVTYDQSVYHATATVVDNHDGTLGVTWAFTDADGNEAKAITFANTYQITQPGSVTLGASKVLDGRELKAGEFSFELKDADGKVLQTVENAADGSVVFDPITYDEPGGGTYEYTISEALPEDDDPSTDGIQKDHVTYDETVYHATVTVTDNGDGTTTATVSYDGTDGKLPVFKNTYTAPDEPAAPQKRTSNQGGKLMQTGDSSLTVIGAVLGIGVIAIAAGAALKKRG